MPAASRSSRVARADSRTFAGSNSRKLTEGMRTSCSRFARTDGMRSATRGLIVDASNALMRRSLHGRGARRSAGDAARRLNDLADRGAPELRPVDHLLERRLRLGTGDDHRDHDVETRRGDADLTDRAVAG